MKKILFLCLIIFGSYHDTSAQYRTSVTNETKDAVTFRCIGYGRKAKAASVDAELSALKTLLFTGTSGTYFSMPLIQDDRFVVETKYKKFFNSLYDSEYRNFIESSVIVTPFGKNDLKQKCITMDVCIRGRQLRTYLENNGIIRKFGL